MPTKKTNAAEKYFFVRINELFEKEESKNEKEEMKSLLDKEIISMTLRQGEEYFVFFFFKQIFLTNSFLLLCYRNCQLALPTQV